MLELLTILYRWKWHVAIFCTLAVLASVIFSGPKFMPPYFESFSVFYPSNPAATDRATLFGEDAGNRQINYFGTKNDVNRILTIANSGGLMNHLIEKYNLAEHYDVDLSNPKAMYYVAREFNGNYEAIKTDRDAIQISLVDQDPNMASDMTNDAVQYINEVNNNIIRDNKSRTITILQQEIESKTESIEAISNQIKTDRTNVLLHEQLGGLSGELIDLKQLYDQYKVSANEGFASIYIIESAAPALAKAKPVRWMIVALTGLGAFVFSVLISILLEKFKLVKENA
ncbi:MAG: hypothetical protein GY751_14980 [Bacteroidetes bacterium]|nr:hypothetical protein [Bacteroidota bacterium]